MEHGPGGVVTESNVAKFDATADGVEGAGVRRSGKAIIGIEYRADAFEADGGLRDVGAGSRQFLDGPEELTEIGQEDDERTGGHGVGEDDVSAEPEYGRSAERDHSGDHGADDGSYATRMKGGLHTFKALGVQPLALESALGEGFHDADGAEAFRHDAEEFALAEAHIPCCGFYD